MSLALFTPVTLGPLPLANRIVMAPMTRSRAVGNVPNELMTAYYRARAGAGLIVTEGTSPSPNGLGYARIPGLFTTAQAQGWRQVTNAVHDARGRVFVQLMHTGRVGHPANLPAGARIVAPSAIGAPGLMWTDGGGMQPHPVPEEMTDADISQAIAEYGAASSRAIDAGFDGVELHGANGYLIDQFLDAASNQRTDRWGGLAEGSGDRRHANRIRFAVAVARAAAGAVGASRVGMRISPYGAFNGMTADSETDGLYEALIARLNNVGLAYIHVVDHSSMGSPEVSPVLKARIRAAFAGRYILSGGYDGARANADLDAGRGDFVAFGRPFIANPNLVDRLRSGAALAAPDPATFYSAGAKGYTDY